MDWLKWCTIDRIVVRHGTLSYTMYKMAAVIFILTGVSTCYAITGKLCTGNFHPVTCASSGCPHPTRQLFAVFISD